MTNLENRFLESAISFFTRNRKSNFIEVTTKNHHGDGVKIAVNRLAIVSLKSRLTYDTKSEITLSDGSSYLLAETYDEVKAML